jgi:hypothetical protein
MTILKNELLQELDGAKRKLDSSKIENATRRIFKDLEDQTITNISLQDKDNCERQVEVIANFREAWNYGQTQSVKDLDLITLTEISGRVEPSLRSKGQSYADLRREMAQMKGEYVPPIDEQRIRVNLERTMEAEKSMSLHPVERAIFDYFHLIRIQPFSNGNKRTAGVYMNTILRNEGFLPISIADKESSDYKNYLFGAIEGFRNKGANSKDNLYAYQNPDKSQLQFYDFLGRKELDALRGAENKLAGITVYDIAADYEHPGVCIGLKHKLTNYFRARDLPFQIKIDRPGKNIRLVGEMPFRTLDNMVKSCPGIKHAKIEIE